MAKEGRERAAGCVSAPATPGGSSRMQAYHDRVSQLDGGGQHKHELQQPKQQRAPGYREAGPLATAAPHIFGKNTDQAGEALQMPLSLSVSEYGYIEARSARRVGERAVVFDLMPDVVSQTGVAEDQPSECAHFPNPMVKGNPAALGGGRPYPGRIAAQTG